MVSNRLVRIIIGIILLLPAAVFATGQEPPRVTIAVRNGDQISGRLTLINGRSVELINDYLGPVRLPLEAVSEMSAELPVLIVLKDGTRLHATLTKISKSIFHLTSDNTTFLLDRNHIQSVHTRYPTTAPTPAGLRQQVDALDGLSEFKVKHWEGGVDFGYTLNRSTTTSDDLNLRFRTRYMAKRHSIRFAGHIFYGIKDDDLSQKEFFGSVRYDYQLGQKFYTFGQFSGEYDAVEQIDFRQSYNLGLGLTVYDQPSFNLSFDAGFGYMNEHYLDQSANSEGTALVEQHLQWKLNHRMTLGQNFSFIPYITGLARSRFLFDLNLNTALSKRMIISFGILDKYDSRPQEGVRKNNFTTLVSLGFLF
jgi:putative salt-induced outer membrane protein